MTCTFGSVNTVLVVSLHTELRNVCGEYKNILVRGVQGGGDGLYNHTMVY